MTQEEITSKKRNTIIAAIGTVSATALLVKSLLTPTTPPRQLTLSWYLPTNQPTATSLVTQIYHSTNGLAITSFYPFIVTAYTTTNVTIAPTNQQEWFILRFSNTANGAVSDWSHK